VFRLALLQEPQLLAAVVVWLSLHQTSEIVLLAAQHLELLLVLFLPLSVVAVAVAVAQAWLAQVCGTNGIVLPVAHGQLKEDQ
jgi:hypothetical protein